MTVGVPIRVDAIIPALKEHRGNVTKTAEALGVDRETLFRKISKSPELQAVRDAARDRTTDLVETAFEDKAIGGDVTAQIFYLKTRAKARGYVERQEITGANGQEIRVTYVNRRRTTGATPETD